VLRSHHAAPSEVLHVACEAEAEFILWRVHPPQPFCGRVTSTIQCGLRKGEADAMKVFQSLRFLGAKSLVPRGQLFFWVVRRVSKQPVHLIRAPVEYDPTRSTTLHEHPAGLPSLGLVDILLLWQ